MTRLSPQTLTSQDQAALLRQVEASPREALLFSLALGTGLRLAEMVGLDVGDVFLPGGVPRVRIRLRREIAKRGRAGDLFLPDKLRPKLGRFWAYKQARGERLDAAAPLFCSQAGRRLSKRRVQVLFRQLQKGSSPVHGQRNRFAPVSSSPSRTLRRCVAIPVDVNHLALSHLVTYAQHWLRSPGKCRQLSHRHPERVHSLSHE